MEKEELEKLLEPILAERGFELVDFEFSRQGKRLLLRFFIDRLEGGITVDELAEVNQEFGSLLDLEARLNEQAAINGELRMTILCCIWRDRSRDDSRSCCTKRRISSSGQFKRRKDNRIAPTEINFTCCSNIGMLQKAVKLVRIRG